MSDQSQKAPKGVTYFKPELRGPNLVSMEFRSAPDWVEALKETIPLGVQSKLFHVLLPAESYHERDFRGYGDQSRSLDQFRSPIYQGLWRRA